MTRDDWRDIAVPVIEALERMATSIEYLDARFLRLTEKIEDLPAPSGGTKASPAKKGRGRRHPTVSVVPPAND